MYIIQGPQIHRQRQNIIKDEYDIEDDVSGNSEITGVDGNQIETQDITVVSQTNTKGNSPKNGGNPPEYEGNNTPDHMIQMDIETKNVTIHKMMTKFQLKMNYQRIHR